MAEKTAIAWTERTFNPWVGCMKVSPGCANCYAETVAVQRMKMNVWGPAKTTTRHVTGVDNWRMPRRWNREAGARSSSPWSPTDPRMLVFCASMCDVFEDHPIANRERPRLWDLVRETPHLQWQILTKRPERIAANLPPDWNHETGWPNVWLGTSIETMEFAGRADELRKLAAVVRFISYEPALGPLDAFDLTGIDWVIYGGESGPGWRQHDLAWPRAMRVKCRTHRPEVAFFYKQSAAYRTELGITALGGLVRAYPIPRPAPALAPEVLAL